MEFLEKYVIELEDYKLQIYDLVLMAGIILGGILLYFSLKSLINRRVSSSEKSDSGKLYAFNQISKYFIATIVTILILEVGGIDVTLLIAGSTALLVGIGFGLQNTFNDLISGLIILLEGSIKLNDIIEVDNLIGEVKQIGLRTSKIQTRENIMLIIPNSKLVVNNLNNWSHNVELMRFSVRVGVDYGSDVDQVRSILIKSCDGLEGVSNSRKPFVRFIDFGNSSLDFELFFFSNEKMWIEDIKSNIRFRIRRSFLAKNIRIPFPQRDLHIKEGSFTSSQKPEEVSES